MEWKMAHDFPRFSKAGRRSSLKGLDFALPAIFGDIEKKTKACGPSRVKGNMLSVKRQSNPWEKTRFASFDLLREVKNYKTLLDSKRALRPLLNAIRFVESSNRAHCPDGDNGASIGPLQISEEYHMDAWKHKKTLAWTCCRDLEHAENTVIAYWSRYCMDALVKNDWEALAKIHNGGPQGPARVKTVYYWSKVLQHLQQTEASPIPQSSNSRVVQTPGSCLEFTNCSKTDIMKTSRNMDKKRGFPMVARSKNLALPAIVNKSSKLLTPHRRSKSRRSFKVRFHKVGTSPQTLPRVSGYKQHSPLRIGTLQRRTHRHLSGEAMSDRVSMQSALHFGYWSFPWSFKREKAAIVIQAYWRMQLVRLQYQSLQHATLSLQRRWRETRRQRVIADRNADITKEEAYVLNIPDRKSGGCGTIDQSDDLLRVSSAPESMHNKDIGGHCRDFLKVPDAVDSLYDSNISATQEDEILTELASFLPGYGEESDITYGSRGRNKQHVLPGAFVIRKDLFLSIENSAENVVGRSPAPPPYCFKTWTYDMCNLDSPSSPGKELTFANLSKDRSIPPTPIKDWSSRKQGPVKDPSEGSLIWTPIAVDMIELPPSPTKEWASPTSQCTKNSAAVKTPANTEVKQGEYCVPKEWYSDLDRSEFPESWWGDAQMIETPCSHHSECKVEEMMHLKSPCTLPDLLDRSPGMKLSASQAMMFTPKGCDDIDSPSHQTKEWDLSTDSPPLHNTPVATKHIAYTSPKTVDLKCRDDCFSSVKDVDSFSVTHSARSPAVNNHPSLKSPVSPAMEEELLDELTKLFEGEPYPAVTSSKKSEFTADSLSGSLRDAQRKGLCRSSKGKTQSRLNGQTFGSDGFLEKSVRNLNFSLASGYEPGGHLKDEDHRCTERRNVITGGNHLEVLEGSGMNSTTELKLPIFTSSEPNTPALQAGSEMFEIFEKGAELKEPEIPKKTFRGGGQESDDSEFLLPDICISDQSLSVRISGTLALGCLNRSSLSGCDKLQGLKAQQVVYGEDVGFCDKAVDGDVVAVDSSRIVAKDVSFAGWQMQLDQELLNSDPDVTVNRLSSYQLRASPASSSSNSEVELSYVTLKIKSGATGLRPEMQQVSPCTHDSGDQLKFEVDDRSCAPEEDTVQLAGSSDMEKLLQNGCASPASLDSQSMKTTTVDTCSAVLSKQDRSSSLSVSRKYFLTSPSMRFDPSSYDSDYDCVTSTASGHPIVADCLFESLEKTGSTEYGRALFACEESAIPKLDGHEFINSPSSTEPWVDNNFETIMKDRDMRRFWGPENLSGPLLLTSGRESSTSLRTDSSTWNGGFTMTVGHPAPCLQDLCKLWDEECVDLLTRSLKYKCLMTDPQLLSHEVRLAYEDPQPSGPQAIAWEIQNIERLLEKLENREALKELVKQQRDNIYINIATNSTMRERYRLYSKWGIRRVSRGRLKKIIYEMLWKDSKRYHASADLVLEYL